MRSTSDTAAVAAVDAAAMMAGTDLAPLGLVLAVGLILLGWRAGFAIRLMTMALAAVLLGLALPRGAPDWLEIATAASALAAMRVVHKARVPFSPGPTMALLAWVPIAAYGAVPDTEQVTVVAIVVCAVAAGAALAGTRPTPAGTAALVGLVIWAIGVGATGRGAAAIGAYACFGVLWLGPFARMARAHIRWTSSSGIILGLIHVACGVAAARFAGLETSVASATWRVAVVLVPTMVAGAVVVLGAKRKPYPAATG